MTPKQRLHHKIANDIRAATLEAERRHRREHMAELQAAQSAANEIRTELGLPPIYLDAAGVPFDPLRAAIISLQTGGQR